MQSMTDKISAYKRVANLEFKMKMQADLESTPDVEISTAAGSDRQQSLEKLYQAFCNATDYYPAKASFVELCSALKAETGDVPLNYEYFRENLCGNTTKDFYNLLDQKASQAPYKNKPCKGKKVLIIGGGPCGLRAAVEICLLGGEPIVVEKRDYFSRNNVANLWDFVVKDLKSIGGKVLQRDLCVRHDRASIKIIQLALFKVSMLMGTTYHAPVEFKHILLPNKDNGWRAVVSNTKMKDDFEISFDFVIGADGKKNSLDFIRSKHPRTLAIGITCNFVYSSTKEEIKIASDRQGAVARIYRQEYFKGLQDKGFDLENIVYFVDKTHYFIFTAKKDCLLRQGVLKSEDGGEKGLLHPDNTDMNQLERFSSELVQHITEHKLPNLQFATNHHGSKDISIFDFTNFFQAEQACRIVEAYDGIQLLQQIVGDTLIEPFWPIGSGMALGFLSVFDAVWTIRNWCLGTPVDEVVHQRKDVFSHMTKINHDGLRKHSQSFTIDPDTRYKMRPNSLLSTLPTSWQKGNDTHERSLAFTPWSPRPPQPTKSKKSETYLLPQEHDSSAGLGTLGWYQEKLAPFNDKFTVENLNTDWYDGRAFCALVHLYKPELISLDQMNNLDSNEREKNKKLAFGYLSKNFGLMTPEDILSDEPHRILPEYLFELRIKLRQLDSAKNRRKGALRRRPKTMTILPKDIKLAANFLRARAYSTEDIPTKKQSEKDTEEDIEEGPKTHIAYTKLTLTQGSNVDTYQTQSLEVAPKEVKDSSNVNNNDKIEVDDANGVDANKQASVEDRVPMSSESTGKETFVTDDISQDTSEISESNNVTDTHLLDDSVENQEQELTENIDNDEDNNQNEAEDDDINNQNSHNATPTMESDASENPVDESKEIRSLKKRKAEMMETLGKVDDKVNELEAEEERLLNRCLEIKKQKTVWKGIRDKLIANDRMMSLRLEERRLQESISNGGASSENGNLSNIFDSDDEQLQTLLKSTQEELRELSLLQNDSEV